MPEAEPEYWRLRPNAPRSDTVLCAADEVAVDAARGFTFGRGRSAFSMFVVRDRDVIRGYLNLCPHFSLPLNHEPDGFVRNGFIECVQHFAQFRIADGECFSGACLGSRITPIALTLGEDGVIRIA
jgi:nitrite reductase/ring-hydroxylating ferredoxin subunit